MEINIGLFGVVSTGKSTFINAISGQQYSDTEIKRTTMVPQVYLESDNSESNAYVIRYHNRQINESIMKIIDLNQFSIKQCQPIYHNIDRICDLFDPSIIDSNLKINIYDVPGLNDSSSKNIYFEWVRQNVKLFDIIIFITDITKGLNNSDEIEILKLLLDSMTRSKSKMICLMNKCDDIYFDDEQNDLVFEEKEQENIYIQANNTLVDLAKMYGFTTESQRFTAFLPISAENCFIYRALMKNPSYELDKVHQNRLCKNEYGSHQWKKMSLEDKETAFNKILANLKETYNVNILDTGYLAVKSVIQNTIIANKLEFITDHIESDIKELRVIDVDNVVNYINEISKCKKKLDQIKELCGVCLYDVFWTNVIFGISNYCDKVSKMNTKIIRGRDFVDFKEFDNIHSLLQGHCMNLISLVDILKDAPQYPTDFMKSKEKILIDKLLNIYEQLCLVEPGEQVHTSPNNLLCYLLLVHTNAPDQLHHFSTKFLELSCNPKCRHVIQYQKELLNLVSFIIDHSSKNIQELSAMICKIFINKQIYVHHKYQDQYLNYLCRMKKILKSSIAKLPNDKYTPFDILYEVVNKNISTYLGCTSVSNIYRPEIDYSKVDYFLYKFFDFSKQSFDFDFEINILDSIIKKFNHTTFV